MNPKITVTVEGVDTQEKEVATAPTAESLIQSLGIDVNDEGLLDYLHFCVNEFRLYRLYRDSRIIAGNKMPTMEMKRADWS
jgi:hypothetical protein